VSRSSFPDERPTIPRPVEPKVPPKGSVDPENPFERLADAIEQKKRPRPV